MDPAQRVCDPLDRVRLTNLFDRDRRPLDESGDEIALRPDERGDLGADADTGRRDGRGVLDLPADAEQMRVVAGQPDDVALR